MPGLARATGRKGNRFAPGVVEIDESGGTCPESAARDGECRAYAADFALPGDEKGNAIASGGASAGENGDSWLAKAFGKCGSVSPRSSNKAGIARGCSIDRSAVR